MEIGIFLLQIFFLLNKMVFLAPYLQYFTAYRYILHDILQPHFFRDHGIQYFVFTDVFIYRHFKIFDPQTIFPIGNLMLLPGFKPGTSEVLVQLSKFATEIYLPLIKLNSGI